MNPSLLCRHQSLTIFQIGNYIVPKNSYCSRSSFRLLSSKCNQFGQHPCFLPIWDSKRRSRHGVSSTTKAAAGQQGPGSAAGVEDWLVKNEGDVRGMPLLVGVVGGALVVANRALSGIAPVADASSAQSRADVLCVALAATLVLTGLVWKSVQSKPPVQVELEGVDCFKVDSSLSPTAATELQWAWGTLQASMRCRSLVILYRDRVALQAGMTSASSADSGQPAKVDIMALKRGSICQNVARTGRASYLANLALFPSRFELAFLPGNTQAVIVQPLGDEGFLLAGSDTVRGFGPSDQVWIATLAEKLDSTLSDNCPAMNDEATAVSAGSP